MGYKYYLGIIKKKTLNKIKSTPEEMRMLFMEEDINIIYSFGKLDYCFNEFLDVVYSKTVCSESIVTDETVLNLFENKEILKGLATFFKTKWVKEANEILDRKRKLNRNETDYAIAITQINCTGATLETLYLHLVLNKNEMLCIFGC